MKIAIKIHKCLSNGADAHELLDLFNKIKDKDTLALVNEYFMEQYDVRPNELISEKYKLDDLYAISSTLNFIREPSKKNKKNRKKFYEKIGYPKARKKKK